jgi:NAD(P)-dependent dehydrogenase (short-subunit alcohol dehydrogenase family)
VEKHYGALHVLVNNAGVAPDVRADVLEAGEESFERLMRINLQGPYFLTQAAANFMVRQKKADASFAGAVVTVTSVSAEVASVNRGDYWNWFALLKASSQNYLMKSSLCHSKGHTTQVRQEWHNRLPAGKEEMSACVEAGLYRLSVDWRLTMTLTELPLLPG